MHTLYGKQHYIPKKNQWLLTKSPKEAILTVILVQHKSQYRHPLLASRKGREGEKTISKCEVWMEKMGIALWSPRLQAKRYLIFALKFGKQRFQIRFCGNTWKMRWTKLILEVCKFKLSKLHKKKKKISFGVMLALRSIQPEVHYSNRKVESQEKRGRKTIQIPHLITERIDLERLPELPHPTMRTRRYLGI